MELAFRVNSYKYLKDLLLYLADKDYYWSYGDELSNMEFAEWLWNFFNDSKELLIVLEEDGVYYDSTIHKDCYSNILYYDTVEELDNATYIVPNQASTVRKKIEREYVVYAPEKLRLKGHSETSLLARNGDTYLIESVMVYGEHVLFTKEEAEKALKELGLDWELSFLQVVDKE